MQKPWHSFSIEKTFRELRSRPTGLTEAEVKERLKKFGPNQLPEKRPFSKLRLFLEQLKSPLIYILIVAGLVTLVLGEYTDTIVIFGAVLLNTIVGYFQENKACQALRKLKKVLKIKAIVWRDGQEKEIFQEKLVPGDIVLLRPGDKVPADARIIEARNLRVNESVLTGEWLAAEKITQVLSEETPLADRDNMVYLGTIVEDGKAKVVVTETGPKTEMGKVALMLKEAKEEKTPLQKKLAHFSKILGGIIVVICIFIFIEGMLTGNTFLEMFTVSVALAVAAIPEGLPVAMTVILAIGMQRILKRKGLVRKLVSTETLGSTSIILTDKTGTLTEAKMEIAGVFTGTKELLSDGRRLPEKINQDGKESHILALKIALLCSEAFIENFEEPMEKWIIRGRPTDKALLLAGIQVGLSKKELEKEQPRIDQFLFDPVYKYSASLHQLEAGQNILYVLGAPEKILARSTDLDIDGEKKNLLLTDLKGLKEKYEGLTRQGLRVLAVGYKKIKNQKSKIKNLVEEINNLVFVGFLALHDPIRREAQEAIQLCRQAGLKPIIVTGDHRLTAQAVAEKLGFKVKKENILEGQDLTGLSDEEFEKRLKDIQIYARVEPAQKLRIVRAWQKKGQVVAMTGDGINDAPALKEADIGVALGSGTDVAKEVSDLILLPDSFNIIVAAVEEGRVIIDNIRKVITYLLSTSISEVILIGVTLPLGFPLPLLAAQILWINLIEGALPAFSLGMEPKEKDIMERKPEGKSIPLLIKESKALIFIIGLSSSFILLILFFWFLGKGEDLAYIRTMIFACLALESFFFVFSCRSLRRNLWQINPFSNKYLLGSWVCALIMLLLAIYLPPLQTLLRTVPLGFQDWLIFLSFGIIGLIFIETIKWYFIAKKEHL